MCEGGGECCAEGVRGGGWSVGRSEYRPAAAAAAAVGPPEGQS